MFVVQQIVSLNSFFSWRNEDEERLNTDVLLSTPLYRHFCVLTDKVFIHVARHMCSLSEYNNPQRETTVTIPHKQRCPRTCNFSRKCYRSSCLLWAPLRHRLPSLPEGQFGARTLSFKWCRNSHQEGELNISPFTTSAEQRNDVLKGLLCW